MLASAPEATRAERRVSTIPFWERLFCTPKEAKQVLSCGHTWLFAKLSDGTIRSKKIGGKRLIDIESLKALVE